MNSSKLKFLWYSDLHLNSAFPWSKLKMVMDIKKENPDGIFLTGDISNGLLLKYDLGQLAKNVNCPIYFNVGNHDYFWEGIEKTHNNIRELCKIYPNLHWMTESGVKEIADDIAVIGTEGWYDLALGDPKYIKFTFDWFCIPEIRKLPNFEFRFETFKDMATESCKIIEKNLLLALEKYRTIYLLTHFPLWKENSGDDSSFVYKYWLPYNINYRLGVMIQDIMSKYKKNNLIVLAGHVHQRSFASISRNIMSLTSAASYWGTPKNENRFFI